MSRWQCSKCTLENKPTAKKCKMCGNKYSKPTKSQQIKNDEKCAKDLQRLFNQQDDIDVPESLIKNSHKRKKRRVHDMSSDEENEVKKSKKRKIDQNSSKIVKATQTTQQKLKQLLLNGFDPRNVTVKMAKINRDWDYTLRSRSIHRLYETHFNIKAGLTVIRKSQGNKHQIESIQRFVNKNNLGSINGQVEYKTNKSGNYKWRKPQEIIKIITFQHHRIAALNGQKGVVARKQIPKNTCISQYSGVEYTEDEWNIIYYGSNKFIKHRAYLCSSDINNQKITIDAMELSDKQYGLYINDYRQNIFQSVFVNKGDDLKYHNTDFCEVLVNNYPAVFMVTKKTIEVNEELCCYYGELYGGILKEIALVEGIQRHIHELHDQYETIGGKNT